MKVRTMFIVIVLMVNTFPSIAQQDGIVSVNGDQLSRITREASFEFSNYSYYSDENAWNGKTIAVTGSFVQQPVIGKGKGKFVQLVGKGSYGVITLIIYIDNDLTMKKVYGNDVPVFTNGMEISAFVQIRGASNFVNNLGQWMYLPTADGLLFFAKDDQGFRYPLWASRTLKR